MCAKYVNGLVEGLRGMDVWMNTCVHCPVTFGRGESVCDRFRQVVRASHSKELES
jgi:hypothetical protein